MENLERVAPNPRLGFAPACAEEELHHLNREKRGFDGAMPCPQRKEDQCHDGVVDLVIAVGSISGEDKGRLPLLTGDITLQYLVKGAVVCRTLLFSILLRRKSDPLHEFREAVKHS